MRTSIANLSFGSLSIVGQWHQRALWVLSGLTLLILLLGSNRAWSALDESYYLALIADPTRFKANLHAFGFPMHLAFVALGRSVIALRLAGIVLLVITGALLGRSIKRFVRDDVARAGEPPLLLLGALFNLAAFVSWTQTPGYNALLSMSGCILLAGALSWIANDREATWSRDWLASVAVGLGGCFAFFAKPPAAMFGAFGIAIVLLLCWRRHGFALAARRTLIVGATCLVPLLLILQIVVGIDPFIEMVQTALRVLKFNNGPLELPGRTLRELVASPAIVIVSFGLFVITLVRLQTRAAGAPPIAWLRLLTSVWLCVALAFLGARILYRAHLHATPALYVGMPTIAVTLSALACAFAYSRGTPRASFVGLVCLLAAIPFLCAYGSADPLLMQIVMWLYGPLFALVLAGRGFFSEAIARSAEVLCASFVLFVIALAAVLPWGLPAPVYRQTVPITVPFTTDTLRVDPMTARYAADLERIKVRGRLADTTPVLDLTGAGAGTALLLNNRAPFLPWVFPMFEHSAEIADAIWDSMSPAEQRAAWIVTPIDPRFGTTRVAAYLARHRADYRVVGKTSMDFGYIDGGERPIVVWQPVAPPPSAR